MPNWKKLITSGSDASLNTLLLSGIVNAGTDTDKFLVLDSSGNVDFRTGANVLADIEAQASSTALTTSTTFGGDVGGTYNNITVTNDSHTHNANNLTGTTLANGVVDSSLTSVGTIDTGTWQGDTVEVAYGGTGAATAANARTNLGLKIGADVLAYDSNLQSFVTTFTLPTTDGSPAQVLKTDGSGNLGFATLSSGGSGYEWFDGTTYTSASVDVRITSSLDIYKSGSGTDLNVFTVDGGQGRLFEITDQLSGSLFSVNNISGVPVFEVFSDDVIQLGTHNDEAITINGNQCTATGSFSGSFEGTLGSSIVSNQSNNRVITSDGDGTFNAENELTYDGTRLYINGALRVGATSTNPSTTGQIRATNDIIAYNTSDKRFKENISNITTPLDKISKINGVEFDWKPLTEEEIKIHHSNVGHDIGVIAQEIEEVLPEAVTTRDTGYKAVRYEKIVPLLIESIKELKAEIEELKGRL